MMPMMAMPTMVPMMMPMPTDLGGLYPGTLLHRRGGAGIGQRQRLGAFGWSGQDQQSAHCSKSQKSRHVHVFFSVGIIGVTPTARLIESSRAAARTAS
jgi:hypothetical protein